MIKKKKNRKNSEKETTPKMETQFYNLFHQNKDIKSNVVSQNEDRKEKLEAFWMLT